MPGRKVTEAARERETFKYDSALLTNSVRNDIENLIPSSALRPCSDPSLTALAQIAVLRLNASRALISLFDREYQHIVAEATPALRISSHHPKAAVSESDSLWLCGTAIPRSFGVCERVLLNPDPKSASEAPLSNKLPVTVIGDLATHDALRERSYCQAWPRNRFYAGVPIRSRRGINIGVLCIFDSEPRSVLDEASVHLMQDISAAILKQLGLRRSGDGRRPGERMMRGLGSYVEGKATMSGWQDSLSQAFQDNDTAEEGAFNKSQQELQNQHDWQYSDDDADLVEPEQYLATSRQAGSSVVSRSASRERGEASDNTASSDENKTIGPLEIPREAQVQQIFSRAANILRESVEVEGVLFLDASIGSFAGMVGPGIWPHNSTTNHRSSSSASSSVSSTRDMSPPPSTFYSQQESEQESARSVCGVLGFSTSESSSIDDASAGDPHQTVPEPFLRKLLRRYPRGKIFNFDDQGAMISSESSSEDTATIGSGSAGETKSTKDRRNTNGHQEDRHRSKDAYRRQNESAAIAQLFPSARSVCFVPLWDSHRQRWFAGGFIYTKTPNRFFTVRGELSYLSAFAAVIMADVALMDSALATTATTSLIGSLSHELRSPLHGIVLCTELLRDSSLNVFQGDMLRSLEICGRTMLDTINHLLDWTNINHFMKTSKGQTGTRQYTNGNLRPTIQKNSLTDGMMHITSHLNLDTLVEEVVECVHAGHTYQQQSMLRLDEQRSPDEMEGHPHTRLDTLEAMNEEWTDGRANGHGHRFPESTVVMLDIDPAVDWAFEAPAGAVRRIILNLCGNAVKYTKHGFVKVAAYQESPEPANARNRAVIIEITDTGSGIGSEYLRNNLYRSFTQENTNAPGAGIGLSLVRRFVKALGGSIKVESKIGKGTNVAVKLPLPISDTEARKAPPDHDDFDAQVIELSRLRVSVTGFSTSRHDLNGDWNANVFNEQALLERVCEDWLNMQVINADGNERFVPDLILCDTSYLTSLDYGARTELSSPIIVVCRTASVARELDKSYKTMHLGYRGLFSFISRPVGPRKLARAFGLCFKRWTRLQAAAAADHLSASAFADESPMIPAKRLRDTAQKPEEGMKGYFDIEKRPHVTQERMQSVSDGASTPTPLTEPTEPSQCPQLTKVSRFLLVEDNPINMKILQTYMKKLGCTFDTATNGQQAVDAYRDGNVDYKCILMDISMPVMDGFEATRQIRELEKERKYPRCSIFAISGLASEDAQKEAFATGLDLFLSKPVQLKELSQILRSSGII